MDRRKKDAARRVFGDRGTVLTNGDSSGIVTEYNCNKKSYRTPRVFRRNRNRGNLRKGIYRMGFSMDVSVPVLTVFIQGLLSFFSPCVLPLLPLYVGYLSGGTGKKGEDGRIYYERKKVILHTVFFVLGVSFTFFVLGFGVSAAGRFFKGNQTLFARAGGILVILFGLYQLGVFGTSRFLGTERRLPLQINVLAMSPLTALLMGFTFSFAWTPCVGPALASVLLMAASASTKTMGFVLIGVYTAGFVVPFLAVGLFSTTLLDLFRKHGQVVRYTVKAGAVLMILMGILMFTGKMNAVTGYLSEFSGTEEQTGTEEPGDVPGETDGEKEEGTETLPEDTREAGESDAEKAAGGKEESGSEAAKDPDAIPAIDFSLTDQYGNTHSLSDYRGKTIFLNFWATWCPPCRAEMPDIQKLYEEYRDAGDDSVVFLGIAAPGYGEEKSEEEIVQFLEENGYTYPVVMDTTGEIFMSYGVFSYPTTFMIDTQGNVFGYATGQLSEDVMRSIIRQTVEGRRDGESEADTEPDTPEKEY